MPYSSIGIYETSFVDKKKLQNKVPRNYPQKCKSTVHKKEFVLLIYLFGKFAEYIFSCKDHPSITFLVHTFYVRLLFLSFFLFFFFFFQSGLSFFGRIAQVYTTLKAKKGLHEYKGVVQKSFSFHTNREKIYKKWDHK